MATALGRRLRTSRRFHERTGRSGDGTKEGQGGGPPIRKVASVIGPDEAVFHIAEVPSRVADKFGFRPSTSSVWRWVLKGVNGRRLATLKVGNGRFTSDVALHKFFLAIADRPPKQRDEVVGATADVGGKPGRGSRDDDADDDL